MSEELQVGFMILGAILLGSATGAAIGAELMASAGAAIGAVIGGMGGLAAAFQVLTMLDVEL